ncbi:hypothetical protein B0H14DRAFT_957865 [Mycena olivaceomarginata]|nr:hypothetical protein B0H14DRAFT_957865 [Mycena olivaceomarginata]
MRTVLTLSFTPALGVLDPIWFPWSLASASLCCIDRFRRHLADFFGAKYNKGLFVKLGGWSTSVARHKHLQRSKLTVFALTKLQLTLSLGRLANLGEKSGIFARPILVCRVAKAVRSSPSASGCASFTHFVHGSWPIFFVKRYVHKTTELDSNIDGSISAQTPPSIRCKLTVFTLTKFPTTLSRGLYLSAGPRQPSFRRRRPRPYQSCSLRFAVFFPSL